MLQTSQTSNAAHFRRISTPFRFLHTWLVSSGIFVLPLAAALFVGIYFYNLVLMGFILVAGFIFSWLVGWLTAWPIAISNYLRAVRKEQTMSQLYTPLAGLKDVYETPVSYREADMVQNRQEDITDLIQTENTHLLILGLPGAGKTMALRACLEKVLSRSRRTTKDKIPLYVPMKDYNAYLLNTRGFTSPGSMQVGFVETLFDYVQNDTDSKKMRYLYPYLGRLFRQGRLLLLCDGLNELNSGLLEFVCNGLVHLVETTQNRLVMTCRELDYREQPVLQQLVGPNRAAEALIAPLPLKKIDEFVLRYLAIPPADGQAWNYNAQEISKLIKGTSLRYDCVNPFMLVTLIKTINGINPGQLKSIGSRGLLLRAYLEQVLDSELKQVEWRTLKRSDIILFLSTVAFTMRRVRYRNAIRLGSMSSVGQHSSSRVIAPEELANRLLRWLEEPDPDASKPLSTELDLGLEALHKPYNRADVVNFLECARRARVISISPNGVLSFQHELIAEYFAAEYLYQIHEKNPTVVPFGYELFDEVGLWSEPVAIWAGLVDSPLKLAEHLATWERQNASPLYNVLVLSLVCAGVAWNLLTTTPMLLKFPDNILAILQLFIPNGNARKKLATIFKRCADEGGVGIYRALLPLLSKMEGIADLLLLLDRPVIAELLIDYLVEVADKTAYSDQIEHLKGTLGRMGESIIPQIEPLSYFNANNSRNLRVASLDIQGRIKSPRSIEPLIAYMADDDETILPATVNALCNMGPELVLEAVIKELTNTSQRPHMEQIHWGALNVLQGFLSLSVLPIYVYRPIVNAVVLSLSSNYASQAQHKAQEMLLRQLDASSRRDTLEQEIVLLSLIGSLRQNDIVAAENAMDVLGRSGLLITPYLQKELSVSTSEVVRQRIVTLLGVVRDVQALPDLITLLADPSPLVQPEVAKTLHKLAPESVMPLINVVLSTQATNLVVERAASILELIGKDQNQAIRDVCIQALCTVLPRIVPRGTHHLILVLQALGDLRAVSSLIALLKQIAPTHAVLACEVILALGQLRASEAILPLIDILASFAPPLSERASEVLSSFGELALDELVARMNTRQDFLLARKLRDTLLLMQPFPRQRLLEAFKQATDAQTEQLMAVFLVKSAEVAPFLVDRLFDPDQRIQYYVRRMVADMPAQTTIPPLIEALKRPAEWQPVLADYLFRYRESIPYLVERLGEDERSRAAYAILFRFGDQTLPHLLLGLESDKALRPTRELLIALVRQNQTILPRVVDLFDPDASNLPALSERMQKQLHVLLVHDLADICLPVLIRGLEKPRLIENVSAVLAALVHSTRQSDATLQAVFEALHEERRRLGAETTLIKIGPPALRGLSDLMIHPEPTIAKSAQIVLREMGQQALPLISTAYRDSGNASRQAVALQIFKSMPTVTIAVSLMQSLRSEDQLEIEMALTLLHLRIANEAGHALEHEAIVPALLQEALSTSSYQCILAALLLLGEKTISKKRIADYLADFLLDHPEQSKGIMSIFPVLGSQAIEPLGRMLEQTKMLSLLHRETAGTLGMITRHEKVMAYVHDLANYVTPEGRTVQFNDPRRALYLRAFGGLLANGNFEVSQLAFLKRDSSIPAEREFFEVLLGYRKMPEIEKLKERVENIGNALANEQRSAQEKQEEVNRLQHTLRRMRTEKAELETQLHTVENALTQARNQIVNLQSRKNF